MYINPLLGNIYILICIFTKTCVYVYVSPVYIWERALHISDQNISVHPKKIHVHISVFGKPQIHVHYCIDRDTIQRKKRAKRGCHLRRQPQKLDIAKLVAPRSEHFSIICGNFCSLFIFSKNRCFHKQKSGIMVLTPPSQKTWKWFRVKNWKVPFGLRDSRHENHAKQLLRAIFWRKSQKSDVHLPFLFIMCTCKAQNKVTHTCVLGV